MGSSEPVKQALLVLVASMVAGTAVGLAAQRGAGPAPAAQGPAAAPQAPRRGSPASQRPPETRTPQTYPREQVDAGRTVFGAQCGFCHGRDAAGAGGPDLTRSPLVAEDVRGDRIAPVVRSGRAAQGMPPFALSEADLAAVVAFIHDQKAQADTANGDRRTVDAADLQTGNAAAGQRYFEARCSRCHSATGDFAGLAGRFPPLRLLQRMLYPRPAPPGPGADGTPPPGPQTVSVTLASGQVIEGRLAYRDEFTIALTDANGWYRAWPTAQVTFTVNDPLQAHIEQLATYSDGDMHDVLAYLQTLR